MCYVNRKGFTLIELIIVIVIIGILASIAAPMISNMRVKAICTEAISTLGTIRSAARAYLASGNTSFAFNDFLDGYPDVVKDLGLTLTGLQGTYFGKECYYTYYFKSDERWAYILCMADPTVLDGNGNTAARAEDAERIADNPETGAYIIIYILSGKIKQQNIERSGLPYDDWSGHPDQDP